MNIDFTTTAMIRPMILKRTYYSFSRGLQGIDFKKCRLFLNIDPLPEGDPQSVITVAKQFFGEVQVRIAPTDCFGAAIKWCWSQPSTDYIFHLEDDWILLRPMCIIEMIEQFKVNNVHQVVLRAYPNQQKLSLAPSLIKKYMYQTYARKIAPELNPEVQMKKQLITWDEGEERIPPDSVLVYPSKPIIRDIGRSWMKGTSYTHGSGFLRWKKKANR